MCMHARVRECKCVWSNQRVECVFVSQTKNYAYNENSKEPDKSNESKPIFLGRGCRQLVLIEEPFEDRP
jgi:hypothetical protein